MSISRQEEIISALWAIVSLLCFLNNFVVLGWVFAVKAGTDTAFSVAFAIKEIKQMRK